MTAAQARVFLTDSLTPRYGPGEAAAIARIVLEDAFGIRPGDRDTQLSPADAEKLSGISGRVAGGEPVQYVLGTALFFGLRFKVSPAVLIPRQETEELVAWVLDHLNDMPAEHPAVLDIGLGSGCIGIALKKKCPRIQLYGVEKSPEALAVAVENAENLLGGDTFHFAPCDILQPENWAQFSMLDVVVSNPPYIAHAERRLMPEHVLAHEPGLALFVEDSDPLVFYRAIAGFCEEKLRSGGIVLLECNEFNADQVARLFQDKGFRGVELRNDLSGAARMVRAVKPD